MVNTPEYVWMPREPTEEILDDMHDVLLSDGDNPHPNTLRRAYAAMLAAAPALPIVDDAMKQRAGIYVLQTGLPINAEQLAGILNAALSGPPLNQAAPFDPKRHPIAQPDHAGQAAVIAAPALPAVEQHPDDSAVDRFAAAMKTKLAQKRKEGRGGWDDPTQCSADFLSRLLHEHVAKGDPVDVGNIAMMLHQRGARVSALPAMSDTLVESIRADIMANAANDGHTHIVLKDEWVRAALTAVDTWRCFHCDEVFNERQTAAEHFGAHEGQAPACRIDAAEYRRMEAKEARYAEEDAGIHRAMRRMQTDHAQALRRAEETGYEKGLRDSSLCPCAAAAPAVDGNYRLPCSVHVPPGTTIGKGCKLSTLISCIQSREGINLSGPTINVGGIDSKLIDDLRAQLTAAEAALAHRWECQQSLERTVAALRADLATAEAARDEQCALLAAGVERELNFQLRAERAEAERDRAAELLRQVSPALAAWEREGEKRYTDSSGAFRLELGPNHYHAMRLADEIDAAIASAAGEAASG